MLRRVILRARDVWKVKFEDLPNWKGHMLPEPEERVRELTSDEERALFKALRPDFHALVLFCILTGMRKDDAVTLTWAQIDTVNKVIHLRIKSRGPDKQPHVVPITGEIAAILQGERGRNAIRVFTYVCKKSRAKRRKGERYPFSKSGWNRDWRAALKTAGIEDFRFHDLRHTNATRLLRSCANLKIVQRLLGHKSIATTARYAHANVDDIRAAMEQVPTKVPTLVDQDQGKA